MSAMPDRTTNDFAVRTADARSGSGRPEYVGAVPGVVVPTARGLGPAVDMDRLSRHITRQLTGKENGGPGHLIDVAGAAHGNGQAETLLGSRRRHRRPSLGRRQVR